MVSKKDKRHSERKYTKVIHPEDNPYEEEKWDDWNDYRDGFRNLYRDRKSIKRLNKTQMKKLSEKSGIINLEKMNEKLKNHEKIRKIKDSIKNFVETP